jgi:hypothetical protein
MPYKVRNFTYNGFMGKCDKGYAPYTAEFTKWSDDPGVAEFKCSDGKTRLIPTFAIEGDTECPLPPQDYSHKVIFGSPSHS